MHIATHKRDALLASGAMSSAVGDLLEYGIDRSFGQNDPGYNLEQLNVYGLPSSLRRYSQAAVVRIVAFR